MAATKIINLSAVEPTCGACLAWRRHDTDTNEASTAGECRLNPPTVLAFADGGDVVTFSEWPETEEDESCLCFIPAT